MKDVKWRWKVYEPTHVLMAIRIMLVGVDTFSLTLNSRLSTEKELRRGRWAKMRKMTVWRVS